MDNTRLLSWMTAQIGQLPFLVLFLLGLVMSLSGRWKGQFLGFAAAGFGVLLLGMVLSAYQQYRIFTSIDHGGYASIGSLNMALTFAGIAIRLAGFVLLLIAIFSGRNEPRVAAR